MIAATSRAEIVVPDDARIPGDMGGGKDGKRISVARERLVGASSVQATRLSVVDRVDNKVLVAVGTRNCLSLAYSSIPEFDASAVPDAKKKPAIPATAADIRLFPLHRFSSECGDIHSVKCCRIKTESGVKLVAASDSFGGGIIVPVKEWAGDASQLTAQCLYAQEEPASKRQKVEAYGKDTDVIPVQRWEGLSQDSGNLRGWSGLSFAPESCENVAVTSCSALATRLIDCSTGQTISRAQHSLPPTAMAHVDTNTLIVAEWGSLTLWDTRTGKSQKPATRFSVERTPNLALDCNGSTVGVTGESRLVSLYDTRTWRTKRSFKPAVKHDCVGIRLDEHNCFIAGLDHELVLASQNPPADKKAKRTKHFKLNATPQSVPEGSMLHQNHRMFRSESRWAGFDIVLDFSAQDKGLVPFVGLAESGIMYSGICQGATPT